MRELRLTQARAWVSAFLAVALCTIASINSYGQCNPESGTLSGTAYLDQSNDGVKLDGESGIADVMVNAYGADGVSMGFAMTDASGNYSISGLTDGEPVKLVFTYVGDYATSQLGANNNSNVQYTAVPSCQNDLGLINIGANCSTNPTIIGTCFAVGAVNGINKDLETIIALEHNFNTGSSVSAYATMKETGSVWGLAWKNVTSEIFTSAFVKQYAQLKDGPGAIYRTTYDGEKYVTSLYTDLADLGVNVAPLVATDINDCAYGAQVGKYGLGSLVLSPDEEWLYTINLSDKTLVKFSAYNPTAATTTITPIPDPGCNNNDSRPFALVFRGDDLYIGTTCTEETAAIVGGLPSEMEANTSANVYKYNTTTGDFELEFSTNYIKGYWRDTQEDSYKTIHWLTDLDFTDDGNMLLSLSDRVGHRYCNPSTNGRADGQNPDLLMVYRNAQGDWQLESNGQAGSLTGSGVGNGEGPGGGEFFGYEHWITDPGYHSETALGSIVVLPGSNSVVATVYDPTSDSYSGGLHRYSTINGDKIGTKQLYTRNIENNAGKATGFGDFAVGCGVEPIQIGNYVWLDDNNNGIQDAGENAFANVGLELLDASCNVIGTTTTDAKGYYTFGIHNVDRDQDGVNDGLASGSTYYVKVASAIDETGTYYTLNGNQYNICPASSESTDESDCDLAVINEACSDQPLIEVTTGAAGENNYSFDIGLYTPSLLDVALMKEMLIADQIVRNGSDVDFKITVFNQGEKTVESVTVTDYINAGYIFDVAKNPGWTEDNGKVAYTINTPIAPGANKEIYVKLTAANYSTPLDFLNYAEVSSVTDNTGEVANDVDSTFDDIDDNDNGGELGTATDNQIDDNGIIDEDDHDVAQPDVFDLALKIELKEDQLIYRAGEEVKFLITVYNQGTVDAASYEVTNYIPTELTSNGLTNENWYANGNNISIIDNEGIAAGTRKEHCVTLKINSDVTSSQIVNYAEISNATAANGASSVDFDSVADSDVSNDKGGVVNTGTDNSVNADVALDEDDQDPVAIRLQYVDMALTKESANRTARRGQISEFIITVYNQGTEKIDQFTIVDYFPETLILQDSDWTQPNPNERKAYRNIKLEEPLVTGASYETTVRFLVSPDAPNEPIINYAEISNIFDQSGNDISDFDVDSNADDSINNDDGGVVLGDSDNVVNLDGDEDDHDPAIIFFIESEIVENCICLANATNSDDGQFGEIITINAPNGQTWYIDAVEGLYDAASDAPPAEPTALVTGEDGVILAETDNGDGTSDYTFEGIRIDGQPYVITFRNTNDDIEQVTSAACTYENIEVEGAISLCTGSEETYTVTNPIAGHSYEFTLPEGGSIIETTDLSVTIDWDDAPGGPFELTVANTSGGCQSPTVVGGEGVRVGNAVGSVTCLGNINMSLTQYCNVLVRPGMLVAGSLTPGVPYSVMLLDPNGNVIPNNMLTSEHLGMEIEAKLIEGCSGNTCWATVTVEDKLAPVFDCSDTEIVCYNLDQYPGPVAIDACDGLVQGEQIDEDVFVYECHDEYVKKVTRTYVATDSYGNVSAPCTIDIFVERIDIDDIVYPENITGDDAISCDLVELNEDGFPTLESTGEPTIGGLKIMSELPTLCNMAMDYTDTEVGPIGCVTKVMREFRLVYTECEYPSTGDSVTVTRVMKYTQTIELKDNDAPVFEYMEDITASAASNECEANVYIPAPAVSDECGAVSRVDIKYPGGFLSDVTSGFIELPVGVSEVTYYAYDQCDNLDSAKISVYVQDWTAPTVVCDVPTAIGINSNGIGYAYAYTFDDGSSDACGIDYMQVRRLDAGAQCGPTSSTTFGDYVVFCCEDVGNEIMVELLVVDFAGNENSCMVSVEVQDKFAPTITCPDDMLISCHTDYDLDDLSQFGTAEAHDACMSELTESARFIPSNTCGEGVIERTFTASDNDNSVTCVQRIEVVNFDPFDYYDITFPPNYETTTCDPTLLEPDLLPAPFNEPVLNSDHCDLVGAVKSDQIFDFTGDGSCYKIYRTWTVINWCRMVDGAPETWVGYQTIKVNNAVAPEIVESCDPIEQCTFDQECEAGQITLTKTATDDCTSYENMQWEYTITFGNGDTPISDLGMGNAIDASGEYPLGTHQITYTFRDRCGNETSCNQEFTITNCTPPSAVCNDGLAVELVPMDLDNNGTIDTEMACLNAEQLNASSSHTCGLDIQFSFSADVTDTIKCYDCSDIGYNEVTLWVTDSNGNTDICVTEINVQDNNDTDICASIEDCVEFPDDLTLTTCNPDLSPTVIGAEPTIDTECANCDDFTVTFTDEELTYPSASCNYIVRHFVVTFNCFNSPMTVEGSHIITIFNVLPPTISCPDNATGIATDADEECGTFVSIDPATFTSNCNTGVTISNNSQYADANGDDASGFYPVGTTEVTFTATDDCGNTTQCTIEVTVTDEQAPVCNLQDITINVTSTGETEVTFDMIDNGSFDACGGTVTSVSITPNLFDCDDLGTNTVVCVITDESGNTTTCDDVTVTVQEDEAPLCATQDITVSIPDGSTSISITANQIDNGSMDGCGGDITLDVQPNEFDCDNVGENTVTLTVTDINGNSSTCTATVTVEENILPECATQDITVALTTDGTVTITADQIDNGSTDECGPVTDLVVMPNEFDCENLGENIVTLTVSDQFGNTSTCTATVTVTESLAPLCMTQDITVAITEGNTSVSITADQVDNGSSDGCSGDVDLAIAPSSFDCDDLGENTVTLTVTDESGNTSTCTATVTVVDEVAPECNAGSIDLILDGANETTVDAILLDNGSTDACGEIVNYEIIPNSFDCDDLGTNTVTFIVTDNNGNSSSCEGTVVVTDTIAPVCMVMDITVDLDENGNAQINATQVNNGTFDPCGVFVSHSVNPFVFGCDDIGDNVVVYTAIDNNGNISTCEATVTVRDTVAPECNVMDITISLDNSMGTTIMGSQLDNGSTDACGEVASITVAPDTFTCEEVGDNIVTVTVTDDSGNTSECTATVTVEDNTALTCIAQDVTVFLDELGNGTLTPEEVDNGSFAGCGGVELALDQTSFICNDMSFPSIEVTLTVTSVETMETTTCTANVTVVDTIPPTITCPEDVTVTCDEFTGSLEPFGSAASIEADDNCEVGVNVAEEPVIEDTNECGIGTYMRTFIATDAEGNADTCNQLVTVILGDNALVAADIMFPEDVTIEGVCDAVDPATIDVEDITISNDNTSCFSVTTVTEDSDVTQPVPCTSVFTRTYAVTDACQENGVFTHVQTITVTQMAPTITGPEDMTITVTDTSTCMVTLDLSGFSVENCDDNFTVSNISEFADSNDGGDASGTYPIGVHDITLMVQNSCGATDTYNYTVTVQDTFIVEATCFKAHPLIQEGGTVDVNVNELFINYSLETCQGIVADTVASYSNTNPNDTIRTVGCEAIDAAMSFKIFFYYEGTLIDSCNASVQPEDPNNFCNGGLIVQGSVFTENSVAVEGVYVTLDGSDFDDMSDEEGKFAFPSMPFGGHYEVVPTKDTDDSDGVTTLDLILIQRHILGLQELDSPYKVIASDINADEKLSIKDVIQLRKLILGIYDEFPENTSWRMVESHYEFTDPMDAHQEPFPEMYEIDVLNSNKKADFIGVKIGDVNGSIENQLAGNESEVRSSARWQLKAERKELTEGLTHIEISSEDAQTIQGFQMTINPSRANIVNILPNAIDLTASNFHVDARGRLALSWSDINALDLSAEEVLFTIVVEGEGDEQLIEINDEVLSTEVYNDNQVSMSGADLRWTSADNELVLFQNNPNPWTEQTDISFAIPAAGDVTLTIRATDGRKVTSTSKYLDAGVHVMTVSKEELTNSGVYYYILRYNNKTVVKKMILMD